MIATDLAGLDRVPSPSLLLFPEIIDRNLSSMIEIAGGRTEFLRPHVKTHKLGEVLRKQLDRGIDKVKCATVAEVEMAALAGVPDILLAYQPVGPNPGRLLELRRRHPGTRFAALVDNAGSLATLAEAVAKEESGADSSRATPFSLYLDLDCGMHRSGIAPGEEAVELVRRIADTPGIAFGGLHAYDGHIHQPDLGERRAAFEESRKLVLAFLDDLAQAGLAVPAVVAGGSPTYAMHAEFAPGAPVPWECSPGTPLLWDAGYGTNHPDLPFEPAAALLTRVVSKPTPDTACLDLGYKSVASENPLERRVRFPSLPDAELVGQSEEHLVVKGETASALRIGQEILGIPWHICPSLALHDRAHLVVDGKATGEIWTIHARQRSIGV